MNKPEFTIIKACWDDHKADLKMLREVIFVQEQKVPIALEWDGKDADALHLLGYNAEHLPVATLRYLSTGQIGRMAVLAEVRGQGCGALLINFLLESLSIEQKNKIFLHAQTHAAGFYVKQGFIQQGDIFEDAGIEHVEMVWDSSINSMPLS